MLNPRTPEQDDGKPCETITNVCTSGDTSCALLERLPWLNVNAIDAYVTTMYAHHSAETETSMGKLSQYLYVSERFARFPGRAKVLRMDSVAAARSFGR